MSKTQLKKILRVNPTSDTYVIQMQPVDKMRKRAGSAEVYAPRVKQENEAMPPASDLWSRDTYRVGDGEVRGAMRPGSEDAMKLPSRGHST
jgi:hypothetical protein